ncbi:MAG: tRNA lysidine(34) synthetase TilS [Gemmatimonadetes bacterium]|nr:tRNA lysidine(34) synthetase TilS [Gemmatimonadota bacterium]
MKEASVSRSDSLPERFLAHVRRRDLLRTGDHVIVAVSGGLDSTVLLHLLRFAAEDLALRLHVAHFDHRMREGSEADRRWVQGLAGAWGLGFTSGEADPRPGSEAEARRQRYAFLERVRREVGARVVLTAHHADDQAETVLFRVLRGAGLEGLTGIAEKREPGIVRPLLPFSRAELLEYARAAGIQYLEDPTNRLTHYARNRIRHEVLPLIERAVAPGARRALRRLAGIAAGAAAAWDSLLPAILADVQFERHGTHANDLLRGETGDRAPRARESLRGEKGSDEAQSALARSRLLGYHPYVQARVLRHVLRRLGVALDAAGTRAALEFISSGKSGRTLMLGHGARITREFDRITVGVGAASEVGETPLRIEDLAAGAGFFAVGGRRMRASWSSAAPLSGQWCERFDREALRAPLTLRGWRPGDRLELPYGSKKLKKLFGERRISAGQRSRIAVLVDRTGKVLWVPGVGRGVDALGNGSATGFFMAVSDAPDDAS